ncbi:aminoglycoside phosphotransferase family protein [Nitrosomonas ureae]|uniref:Phosphotransferase enzyme family protein n=1 Tax=Nitrosomonas ureae TaxID=44577 RepID=A0A1H2HMS6_9PROT|nr:phosphotransferase [Nitrosomonas ureae]SDU33143.1 Phosphotransferase enzyme family protein [Nitrosomonas ureae]
MTADFRPNVNFEYRFSRDIKENDVESTKMISLVMKFAEIENYNFPHIESILLYPVERAGKSGSQVFYLDLYVKKVEYPRRYVAKFQDITKTEKELSSARDAAFAQICPKPCAAYDEINNLGILVYNLAKIHNHREFRGFFLDLTKSDQDCASALKAIFQQVGRHPNNKEDRIPFLNDYRRYIDRRSAPLNRLNSFANSSSEYNGIADLAISINKHYERIASMLDKNNVSVFPYLVHGDLHARNLMLNDGDPTQTELIDFGWTHYGHPAKDFILMEITLKYMLLHELLPKISRPESIGLHMPLMAFEQFEQFLCTNGLELPEVVEFEKHIEGIDGLYEHHHIGLRRVYISLIEVRKAALNVLNEYCTHHDPESGLSPNQHFFISHFLVALGLSGFSEVEPIWTLVGLHTVGNSIC